MSIISKRVASIKLSPSVAARVIIAELREKGQRIIDLTIGEPDFSTPANIMEAAIRAMHAGQTKYPLSQGTMALRRAVAERFKLEYGQDYDPQQIIVSTGAKQVLFNALAASLNEGDEVIIPAPYWLSYPDMVIVNGGKPVFALATADQDYKLTPEILEQAITPRTKWLLMNSPSNPTGAIYTRQELRGLCDVLMRHPHVCLMTDDIYSRLNFTGTPTCHPLQVEPALRERTLVVNGVSKAYAMTGWRIGFGAGPRELISAMSTLQSQSTSGACSISQARRDLAVSLLSTIDGLKIVPPDGAFYVFPDCTALLGKHAPDGTLIATATDLTHYILRTTGVALIDGHAYGLPGTFRLSFASSFDDIRDGCEGIRTACESLC
jgi:aspartate aminotransferase